MLIEMDLITLNSPSKERRQQRLVTEPKEYLSVSIHNEPRLSSLFEELNGTALGPKDSRADSQSQFPVFAVLVLATFLQSWVGTKVNIGIFKGTQVEGV